MSRKRKPNSGNPAKPTPTPDHDHKRFFRIMSEAVELTRDMQPRLSEEGYLNLRAGTLGLMWAYAELTGLPTPDQYVTPIEGDAAA